MLINRIINDLIRVIKSQSSRSHITSTLKGAFGFGHFTIYGPHYAGARDLKKRLLSLLSKRSKGTLHEGESPLFGPLVPFSLGRFCFPPRVAIITHVYQSKHLLRTRVSNVGRICILEFTILKLHYRGGRSSVICVGQLDEFSIIYFGFEQTTHLNRGCNLSGGGIDINAGGIGMCTEQFENTLNYNVRFFYYII